MARKRNTEIMTESVLGEEPDEERKPWHDHAWTAQEAQFVSRVLQHGNQSRAYREVYMPEATRDDPRWMHASILANRLMKQPWMQSYVDEIRATIRERLAVTKENVLEEIAKLGYANMADFYVLQEDGSPQFDLSGLTRDQAAAISELTIETYVEGGGGENEGRPVKTMRMKIAPKMPALEALAKHLKLFGDDGLTTNVKDIAEELRAARLAKQKRLAGEDDGQDDGNGDGTA